MRGNNVLGIIFSASCDVLLPELTHHRTTASVPIGGKYRMIDFALSNMANAKIKNIGIIAKSGFMSLMDHVGSGKAWDLTKRHSGITILPPYSGVSFASEIETIHHLRGYFEDATEEYVLLSECNIIANFDYKEMFKQHDETNADITMLTKKMDIPEKVTIAEVSYDEESKEIDKILVHPYCEREANMAVGVLLMRRKLLLKLISECISENQLSWPRLMQNCLGKHKLCAYEMNSDCSIISTTKEYFKFNMKFLNDRKFRKELTETRPVYTKVRDDAPSRYGLDSYVVNSLVSQGCVIEGTIENSVVSKGVKIGKGSVIKNSIIMQDTEIGENCKINDVIIDKDVKIYDNKSLMGTSSYPIYIVKKSVIK